MDRISENSENEVTQVNQIRGSRYNSSSDPNCET